MPPAQIPLAYFNYCRDIIRHKWPFRGFYLCSLGSFTRDAGLLYYRASGLWTGEWDRWFNTWIQPFKYRNHLHKQSQGVAHVRHISSPAAEPDVLLPCSAELFNVLPINSSDFSLFGPAFSDFPTSFSNTFLVHLALSFCCLFLTS